MKQIKKNKINVGLIHIGNKEKSGLQILEKLKQNCFTVTEWQVDDENSKINGLETVDSIIVNIGITSFEFDELLDDLFEKDLNIIINEAELTNELVGLERQSWERHLLNKIDSSFSIIPSNSIDKINEKQIDLKKFGIRKVWVLGASIGGPEAIQEFLSKFNGTESVLFIIIQHIDRKSLHKMAQQLDNNSHLTVEVPVSGIKVTPSSCLLYPTDEFIRIDENGILDFEIMNETYTFSPCIDECTIRLLNNIKKLNMAIFSGMSTDGVKAAQCVKIDENLVIVQNEKTCVLSTIIAGVKESVEVDFEGSPSEMANYIIRNSKI